MTFFAAHLPRPIPSHLACNLKPYWHRVTHPQDLPKGSLEYNNWALALQVQPAQGDEQVKAVVHDVFVSGKAAAAAAAASGDGGVDGSVDVDAYMTSQDLKDA
jgi:hypothetical protein